MLNQNFPVGKIDSGGEACNDQTAGLVIVPGMPNGTLLALGAMGRHLMIVIPSEGVVIASGSNDAHGYERLGRVRSTLHRSQTVVLCLIPAAKHR